jgi:purine-binding chemotaxis protein CheW
MNKLTEILEKQKKQQFDEPKQDPSKEILQLVGFIVDDEEYAIPILDIQEIIKPINITRVPSVPKYILGVFNLRGSVIPLIDLRQRFGSSSIKMGDDTRYIVMKYKNDIAGFAIDKLTEAIRLEKGRIDPAPETLNKDKSLIYGIGKRDGSIITILKVDALLKRDF